MNRVPPYRDERIRGRVAIDLKLRDMESGESCCNGLECHANEEPFYQAKLIVVPKNLRSNQSSR